MIELAYPWIYRLALALQLLGALALVATLRRRSGDHALHRQAEWAISAGVSLAGFFAAMDLITDWNSHGAVRLEVWLRTLGEVAILWGLACAYGWQRGWDSLARGSVTLRLAGKATRSFRR